MPLVNGVDARGLPMYANEANPLPNTPESNSPLDTVLGTYLPTPPPNSGDYSNLANRLSQIREQGSNATIRTQYAVQKAAELRRQEQAQAEADAAKRVEFNKTAASIEAAKKATESTNALLQRLLKSGGSVQSNGKGISYNFPSGTSDIRKKLVQLVASQKGVKYQWGGESPKTGFDCSGLVQWAYGKLGIQMPRTSGPQAKMGVRWPISKLQPGDLVAHPGHIAVYAGNGMMWEAPHTGAVVRLVPVRSDMYGVHLNL